MFFFWLKLFAALKPAENQGKDNAASTDPSAEMARALAL